LPRNLVRPEKRLAARRRIEQLIKELRLWGQRLMPERELAAELGVGRKTLRGALAELEADGLLERRQGAGTFVAEQGVRAGRAKTARVLLVGRTHYERIAGWDYLGEMVKALLRYAPGMRAECRVLALDQPEEKVLFEEAAYARGFDAYVSVQEDAPDLLGRLVGLRRGPVVLLDHTVRDIPVIGIVDGSFEGGRAVTRHLVGLGHRRIAFVDTWNREAVNPWKHGGYRTGLADRGLAYDPGLVAVPEELGVDRLGGLAEAERHLGAAAVGMLLGRPAPPTAILCFDDGLALAVISELERRGIRPGRDLSVAGLGDSAYRRGTCDWLTSCRTYPRKMGRAALRAALEGGRPREGRTIIVPNRIMIRNSTCTPAGREDWK
jgi:DNA-binding LacI/PurR family transcriptional regulator